MSDEPTRPGSDPADRDLPATESEAGPATDSTDVPAIEAEDVVASFGDESVLDGVDATVEAGELVGLVGPNGAGKTTLLRTTSGALDPDAGTVRVVGDPIDELSSAASSRRIAVVPQTTHLSFAFSVRELVEMGRHPHRSRFQPPSRADRDLVDAAMKRTGTAQFADRSIEDVSGGERQRVLLARAIAQDAPVLLLDEPTANLDLNHGVETMSLVRELVDEDGTAALAAIHDLELAARFCDRVLVLAGGEIVASGAPADVLQVDVLDAAFDARIAVEPSPVDGGVSIRALDDPEIDRRVHVVGSGEPAAAAVGRLGEAGADLSLGPVPAGDRAVSTAKAFGAEIVSAPAFASVDSSTRDRAVTLANEADAVVLAVERLAPDADLWLDCADETDAPVVVLENSALEADGDDSAIGDAESPLRAAPTTDVESLPGTVEAVAARDHDADEGLDRDALTDATLADGGVESAED